MGKIKMCLGTRKGYPVIVDVGHTYICGKCGTGKTTTISSIINSILTLNEDDAVEFNVYSPKHVSVDLGCINLNHVDVTNVRSLDTMFDKLSKETKSKMNYYMENNKNGVLVSGNEFKHSIYVFDDCIFNSLDDEKNRLAISNATTFGELLGITIIIAEQQPLKSSLNVVNQFEHTLVLHTTSELSKGLVGTPIAASREFYEEHKAAYVKKGCELKPDVIKLHDHILRRPYNIMEFAENYK